MNYIPNTERNRNEMLKHLGVNSINELTTEFKPAISEELKLSSPLSEIELIKYISSLAAKNKILKYFVGAGSYDHYSPAVINHLLSRGEFLTGYTPYQPEASQGVLQATYEFQSYICLLTGMEVANASLYDGASALAEAALLSASYTKRDKIFVNDGLNPRYLKVLETYCEASELALTDKIDGKTACVIAQNPDFLGNINNLQGLAEKTHKNGSLFVTCVTEPTSLAILRPPGSYGADIAVGEAQSFGIPISFGGPYLGFIAVKKFLLKKLPGRIVGMTTDGKGNDGFVLTYRAREQDIRRERATSNITTNQSLLALSATMYLSAMGKNGLIDVAKISWSRAHQLHEKLRKIGFQSLNGKFFYNEFCMKIDKGINKVLSNLLEQNIVGGLDIGENRLLICCTEKNSSQDIQSYVAAVSQ